MNIRPIRTEDDLTWALAEVEPYFLNEPENGSADAVRFEILADLIRAYEALHWPIEEASPNGGVDKRFVHRGVAYSDLASVRTVIKNEQIAKLLKRKRGRISASPGRLTLRPQTLSKRTKRFSKTG